MLTVVSKSSLLCQQSIMVLYLVHFLFVSQACISFNISVVLRFIGLFVSQTSISFNIVVDFCILQACSYHRLAFLYYSCSFLYPIDLFVSQASILQTCSYHRPVFYRPVRIIGLYSIGLFVSQTCILQACSYHRLVSYRLVCIIDLYPIGLFVSQA